MSLNLWCTGWAPVVYAHEASKCSVTQPSPLPPGLAFSNPLALWPCSANSTGLRSEEKDPELFSKAANFQPVLGAFRIHRLYLKSDLTLSATDRPNVVLFNLSGRYQFAYTMLQNGDFQGLVLKVLFGSGMVAHIYNLLELYGGAGSGRSISMNSRPLFYIERLKPALST